MSMPPGNNLALRGGGLHHVAVAAVDFEANLRFYTKGLGFVCRLQFNEDDRKVALLDTGDGTYLELFSGATLQRGCGAVLHFALRTNDCDAAVRRARHFGGEIAEEPTDMVLEGGPPVPVRYAFCKGPDGEQIEFLQRDML